MPQTHENQRIWDGFAGSVAITTYEKQNEGPKVNH